MVLSILLVSALRDNVQSVGATSQTAALYQLVNSERPPTNTASESGETMRAAGLKAIATVIDSTAVLIQSKHPSDPKLISLIESRIRGVITAQKYVLCTYNVERANLDKARKITPGMQPCQVFRSPLLALISVLGKRAPTIQNLEEEGWVAVQAMVKRKEIAVVMDDLTNLGATDILVTKLENSRTT